jgi:hypothetical protein
VRWEPSKTLPEGLPLELRLEAQRRSEAVMTVQPLRFRASPRTHFICPEDRVNSVCRLGTISGPRFQEVHRVQKSRLVKKLILSKGHKLRFTAHISPGTMR